MHYNEWTSYLGLLSICHPRFPLQFLSCSVYAYDRGDLCRTMLVCQFPSAQVFCHWSSLIDQRLHAQLLLSAPMQTCLFPSCFLISDPSTLSSPSLLKKSAFQISISTQVAYQKVSSPFTSSNITWTTHICILEFSTFILARPFTIWLLLHRSFAKNTQNLRDKNSKCSAAKSRWKISVKMLAATF